jgi:hypothetical protein
MMARQMGHVLLGEALRFSEPWERQARGNGPSRSA